MCTMYGNLPGLQAHYANNATATLTEPCRSRILPLRMACPCTSRPLCGLHYPDMGNTRDRNFTAIYWTDGL